MIIRNRKHKTVIRDIHSHAIIEESEIFESPDSYIKASIKLEEMRANYKGDKSGAYLEIIEV